ncbi:MAG TPA: THUMP domain-containing protein [Candidatus Krumholzibacteria bacterium]|nr:THUMP domain-containing protein [Candidatus Krumholzibacteria bacterium]
MYLYQTEARYFAQVPDGGEDVAAQELTALGAQEVKAGYRGLYFGAERRALYGIVYRALTITRVLAPLIRFQCHSPEYLYKRTQSIAWSDFLTPKQTFAVFATVSNSAIRHSQYAALTIKDAIVDQFRDKTGARPSVETIEPDLWINLYLHANKATLSIDASGGSMHRRGYRVESIEAPMQETVAAAMLAMSEWDGSTPLVDPMCGSGTILCEALMRYCRVPAGYLRARFGFERLPDFDREGWREIKREADGAIRTLPKDLIRGSDASPEAVRAARANLARLPGGRVVAVEKRRFEDVERVEGAAIVTNPPYGLRIGKRDAMPEFVKRFGDFLKHRCAGSSAFVYFGDRELLKSFGLRPTWKRPLASGGLDGRLVRVDLFAGKRDALKVARTPDAVRE